MIQMFADLTGGLTDDPEIHHHPGFVKLAGTGLHLDFPVMSMHSTAGARIVAQGVGGGKIADDFQGVASHNK